MNLQKIRVFPRFLLRLAMSIGVTIAVATICVIFRMNNALQSAILYGTLLITLIYSFLMFGYEISLNKHRPVAVMIFTGIVITIGFANLYQKISKLKTLFAISITVSMVLIMILTYKLFVISEREKYDD